MQISDGKAGLRVLFIDDRGSRIIKKLKLGSHQGILEGTSTKDGELWVTVDSPMHACHERLYGVLAEALEPMDFLTNEEALILLKPI